ncbi:MAG: T9SS type A sorting domain-containing protein, partial [Saprospiraceae bacterium]
KTHPYTGYARSLYHQLTDEMIQLDIPDIEGIILPRSLPTANELVINSYPNPLKEKTYNIEFKGAKDLGLITIEIYDMFGKIITRKAENILNDDIVQLDTQDWSFAAYIITVKSMTGDLLYSCKFTKMK